MNFVLYAIPFFFLLIAIEIIVDKFRKTRFYRVNDSISSLTAGVLSQMIGVLKKLLSFSIYVFLYQSIAVYSWPQTIIGGVLAFIAYDLTYYWKHRMGHEVSILWAAHVVHHSSEEFNLTTALRQSSSDIFGWVFYLPLAVLGVNPLMLLTVGSLNLVYQFWVHTRHIPKLGWIEWIFVTPSNHRVHHGQNQLYLDKNYGGVFIIWDRLFGTFQEELVNEPPIYGVRKALASWNPVWTNIHVYVQLIQDSVRAKYWKDKLRIWFGRTGWRPQELEERYPRTRTDLSQFTKFDTCLTASEKMYSCLQYLLLLSLGLVVLFDHSTSAIEQFLRVVFIICFALSTGRFLENKSNKFAVEGIKLTLLGVLCFFAITSWIAQVLLLFTLVSSVWLYYLQRLSVGSAQPSVQ